MNTGKTDTSDFFTTLLRSYKNNAWHNCMNASRKKLLARTFRRSSTEAEAAMWEALRDRIFMGLKFRRQYIVQ